VPDREPPTSQNRTKERKVSGGEVALMIIATFWAILVAFLAVVLVRLAKVLKEATRLVSDTADRTAPLLDELTGAVQAANAQLDRVDAIAGNVQTITTNATALSSTVAATVGGPLVKTAAFSYGVRRALSGQARAELGRRVRATAKAERAARQRASRGRG
jgi:predicted PurR-regulated permease PerM